MAKDAFHNSQERSEEANLQTVNDIAHDWTARLRRMSTPSFVVPPSSTSDSRYPLFDALVLEYVIKDIFVWLHDPSTHCLAMWVYDDDRSRTSLIGQAVAEILAERKELAATSFLPNGSFVVPTIAYQLVEVRRVAESRIAGNNDSVYFTLLGKCKH